MHKKIQGFLLATALLLGLTSTNLVQAAPAPRELYETALQNMDMPNAHYSIDLQIDNPVGKMQIQDELLLQRSPLLMRNEVTTHFTAQMLGKFPAMSFIQYTQLVGDTMSSYYSAAPAGTTPLAKDRKWYMARLPVTPQMNSLMAKSLNTVNNLAQLQKDMQTVQKLVLVKDTPKAYELAVTFDCSKMFDMPTLLNAPVAPQVPAQQKMLAKTRELAQALQKSGTIEGTVTIDKSTQTISEFKLNISRQVQVLLPLLFHEKAATMQIGTQTKGDKATGLQGYNSMLQNALDDVTAHVTVKVAPIKDVMELAVPASIVAHAQTIKMPAPAQGMTALAANEPQVAPPLADAAEPSPLKQ